ncbi:2-phospho-L-lactate transferase [Paraoerskovia sediminicola]|uniref:2-phospho-L-lactate transferase n=1 Tax=Paraoerskovia sediminicola TaxID=1138587 RepID=A0ABN6X7M1_9CELL|nr:2-phospho-L-lactate transferase CofD family protein [Paraoerskovia sediminicola]BDZ40716.1 2-phospho-L-lactate transferase [Paraoerskovia sediminicola]BDZ43985.1 2-phospho-L-lactate transferase [Paraoerskovia sediminicola]
MRITLLAGGVGGARFARGLRDHLDRNGTPDGTAAEITVVVNTGDDFRLHGLQVCPDLDTVMYTLGGGIHEGQGWGRPDETRHVTDELHAYGLGWDWFTLGDRDLGTHIARTELLGSGMPLSAATERLCARWSPGARLIPMTDQRCETHVVVSSDADSAPAATASDGLDGPAHDDGARDGSDPDDRSGCERTMHFEEWWVRHRAALPARRFVQVGVENSRPAPGVVDAIERADVILLPPSNPVVSIGTILGVPGIREALAATAAPVVGVSPIIGGAPVRGMADACLTAIGVESTAEAVGLHYGARGHRRPAPAGDGPGVLGAAALPGLLDGWLVDTSDAGAVAPLESAGISARAVPLLMGDESGPDGRTPTGVMVDAALDLAGLRS